MAVLGKKEPSAEEKIMDLFQSHSVLKQEYKQLDEVHHLLKKTSLSQEQKIQELENEIYQIEKHLSKIVNYEDAKVFYQLKLVWSTCNRYIHKFRDRLVDQQSDRERKQQLLEFNQEKTRSLANINGQIDKAKDALELMTRQVHDLSAKIDTKNMPWHYFSRKALMRSRTQAQANEASIYSDLQELYDERMNIESEPWPEFEGLDLDAKRSINLAMIALAQYFFVMLSELGLSNKCYHAWQNKLWDVNYGEPAKQKLLLATCQEKLHYFSELKDLSSEVQSRMQQLKDGVAYAGEDASLPEEESITKVTNDFSGTELYSTMTDVSFEVNVLTDNYWGLKDLLIP